MSARCGPIPSRIGNIAGGIVQQAVAQHVKRIEIDRLVEGMFIHDLSCDWMAHPFFRSRFLVKSAAHIERIRAAGIRFVYIDTARGLDAPAATPMTEIEASVDAALATIVETPAPVARVELGVELSRARKVHSEATAYVQNMMRDARLGRSVNSAVGEGLVERMMDSILRNPGALVSVCQVKDKDQYTFQHSVSVSALMMAFGRSLGVGHDRLAQLGLAGLLHDVGKSMTPDAILNKPARLTAEEYETVKQHPLEGLRILERQKGIGEMPLTVVIQHHERVDGSGYPHRLPADRIDEVGRMGAICDVYDAITADRVYHRGIPPTRALRNLVEWSGTHLDRRLVQHFIRSIGIYPVGSLVRLRSNRLAVVLQQSDANLLQPLVRVIYDAQAGRYLVPRDLDLATADGTEGADAIVRYEDAANWSIDTARFL